MFAKEIAVLLTSNPDPESEREFLRIASGVEKLIVRHVSRKNFFYYDYGTSFLPDDMFSLEELDCERCELPSLPNGMISLLELNCKMNRLTSLPLDMRSLIRLDCRGNKLNSFFSREEIPDYMSRLTYLSCESNGVTSLPYGMKSLKHLYCGGNKLSFLPDDMKNLKTLHCRGNNLRYLPSGMTLLKELQSDFSELEDSLTNSYDRMQAENYQRLDREGNLPYLRPAKSARSIA